MNEDWTAISNFRLTYYGTNSKHSASIGIGKPSTVTGVKVEIFTIDGMRIGSPVKGLNIIRTTIDGKTTIRKVVVK